MTTNRGGTGWQVQKVAHVTAELAEARDRVVEERAKMDSQHRVQLAMLEERLCSASRLLHESQQEARSLQFKLNQKSAGEISAKRADELAETLTKLQMLAKRADELAEILTKLQEEYKRLRAEHDGLKARPDPEDIRKEFREREEKVRKEGDQKQIEIEDLRK
ncbi:hypothetical protein T484DRAFT_1798960, partial [Baffinella frigidus]